MSARALLLGAVSAIVLAGSPGAALADSFTIGAGEIETDPQALDNPGDVGLIEQGGQLTTGANTAVNNNFAAEDATLINNGLIVTNGNADYGVLSNGENFTVENSGIIETQGGNSAAIFARGEGATITNNGTARTVGSNSAGINTDRANARITNSGTITALGDDSAGIESSGDDAVITNSGQISTAGSSVFASGINSLLDDAVITNSGTIIASGAGANGVNAEGANAVITNSGTIRVSGAGSAAVDLNSTDAFAPTNNMLTNTGSLIATGDAIYAVLAGSGDDTVVLGLGSQVVGRIDLGGGNNQLIVITAKGPTNSSSMTIENTDTIMLMGGADNSVLAGDTVVMIDPTGQSFLSAAVSDLTRSVHGAINRRSLRPTNGAAGSGSARAPLQLASLESDTRPRASAGLQTAQRLDSAAADGPAAWGEAFGASGNRGDDGQTLAYDHDYIGAMGGYETAFDTFQLGVAAGFALGSIDTQETSIDTDVESYFVGLYGEREFGRLRLSGSLIGGYEEYESDRLVIDNLNGEETARSDFDNFFISPSVALAAGLPLAEGLELRPSAGAVYTAAFYDSYREEGTRASNLSVDSRTVQVLNTRLQMAVAMLPEGAEIELRGGLEGRFSDQDDVDGSLAGANFSFATTEDESVYGGYVGMNIQVFTADRLAVSGDVEYRSAGGDEDQINGAMRATYRF